jgi:hypothetical protein
MYQFYVLEIQQLTPGSFAHLVHTESDEDPDMARRKGESKYYTVLASAAVSTITSHAAILCSSEGFPLMHKCYEHEAVTEE